MIAMPRLLAVSLLALAGACGGPPSDAAAPSGDTTDVVGAPCMSSASCAKGEICTTQDGVCNPPPGCRPGMVCAAVCYGTCRAATGAPPPSPCRTSADCRKLSDYCQGCNCRALSICQADPVCTGGLAYCFADPCSGKEAYCSAGTCALRAATPTCPAQRCGPALGMPNRICPDGKTMAGPTGRCLQQKDGTCGWEIAACPDPSICTATPL